MNAAESPSLAPDNGVLTVLTEEAWKAMRLSEFLLAR